MNRYKEDEQMDRFWEAETDHDEEGILLQNWLKNEEGSPEKSYASYIRQSRRFPPETEAEVWNYIQDQSTRRKIPVLARWSIAASFAIMLALGGILYSVSAREQQREKFSQLESALRFTAREVTPQPQKEILYEDDLFIIVAVN